MTWRPKKCTTDTMNHPYSIVTKEAASVVAPVVLKYGGRDIVDNVVRLFDIEEVESS